MTGGFGKVSTAPGRSVTLAALRKKSSGGGGGVWHKEEELSAVSETAVAGSGREDRK